MQSIDFVIVFPQDLVKADIYMRPPKVPRLFKIPDLQHPADAFTKSCMLLKHLYFINDYGIKWFGFLIDRLINIGWENPMWVLLFSTIPV